MSETFDFMGQAIKKAREAKEMTREQLAEILDVAPRHIQSIENEGQYPSFPLFIRLVTMFDISVDQYIFSDKQTEKTTLRRQIDSILDTFGDKELTIMLSHSFSNNALSAAIFCRIIDTNTCLDRITARIFEKSSGKLTLLNSSIRKWTGTGKAPPYLWSAR